MCNLVLQVYDFAMKEAAHLLLPNSGDEKEPQRKKKKKNRLVDLPSYILLCNIEVKACLCQCLL